MKTQIVDLVYLTAGLLCLPLILWRRVVSGRPLSPPGERLLGRVPRVPGDGPLVWLHAVSVGEVNQLESLIQTLGRRRPDCRFAISTTTATGLQLARRKHPDITVFRFPVDFSWAIRQVLRRLRPALIVLVELEVWPNLVGLASRQQVPVAVINGRLGQRSFAGYSRFRRVIGPTFCRLSAVVTQDDDYARRFAALGTPAARIQTVGSLKFDQARIQANRCRNSELTDSLRRQIRLAPEETLWVAGSTQQPEEAWAGEIYRSLRASCPGLRLAIAPRHPHRADDVQRSLLDQGIPVMRRSSGETSGNAGSGMPPVLLVDTIGELGHLWAVARIAFVGGSFGSRGGQNMLEPAAAGCATCFGPHTWNFASIVGPMKQAGAGHEVANAGELEQFVARCLKDTAAREQLARRASAFVESGSGATTSTASILADLLDPARESVQRGQRAA